MPYVGVLLKTTNPINQPSNSSTLLPAYSTVMLPSTKLLANCTIVQQHLPSKEVHTPKS